MRDLIRNYKNIIKGRDESTDSGSESQPLMSSSSSHASFSATENRCMFHESDTTDVESGQMENPITTIKAVTSKQTFMRRPFCYPGNYEAPTLNIFPYKEKIADKFNHYSKVNGILTIKNFNSNETVADVQNTQNSLVTIFVIWNTIIGSSLLAMPWGLEKAGLFPGIFLIILVAGTCLYTCNVFLQAHKEQGLFCNNFEISDLCRIILGEHAEVLAKVFSLIVLIGSTIVYWVLMSNFLYHSVHFLYGYFMSLNTISINDTVNCLNENGLNRSSILTSTAINLDIHAVKFEKIWDLYSTVPIALAFLMFPLLNFKNATFFTKFNSLGTLSIAYLLFFTVAKGYSWGINMQSWEFEFHLKPTFCALSGMLSLSYFIHNMIISVMKNNRHQCNNGRDLGIAFGLVAFTYTFIGVTFYVCFPLPKNCIQDNILNNFDKNDSMTVVARLLLLFQLFTVFPLISYVLRLDVFNNISMVYKKFNPEFRYSKVIAVNIFVVCCCVFFSCYLPRIGTLIRYTGAIGGLVYIFLLPSLIKIALLRKEKALTKFKLFINVLIIAFGVLNLMSQFFIQDT